jgi:hypothetical protein
LATAAHRLRLKGRVMTEASGDEIVVLFKQQLELLREGRDAVLALLTASPELIGRSHALLAQLDEQIKRIECELG